MNRTLAVTALLFAAACSRSGGDNTPPPADTTAITPAPAPAPPTDTTAHAAATVTDPQIAAIVVAANDTDIKAGQLATEHGTNAQVKEFAQRMITDHTAVNKSATDLVTRLHVTPESNPTSEKLTHDGDLARSALEHETGAAFDSAYVAGEVAYHQAVLDAIDQTLIPSAQNADLKALLQQTRPAVAAHLEHARRVQAALAGH